MRPVLVFDSGIGGLSIYRPLKEQLPAHEFLYYADSANFPYGDKTADFLQARLTTLAHYFATLQPSVLVVACNTATVNAIELFRSILACPVIGVEPVIKPLASFKSAVALMTTAAALSKQTQQLLIKYGKHVQIYTPKGLAEAIEFNNYEQVKIILARLGRYLRRHHIEAVGLSCTHYPLILSELRHRFPEVEFIDPSPAVVAQVTRVLRSKV